MSWSNPRWGSLIGPDAEALRAIFQSLSDWTANPSFGYATTPTISGSGVKVDPPSVILKNEYVRSPNYVAGSAGWNITSTGNAEFNQVTVRGTVSASTITGSTISGSTISGNTISGGTISGTTISGVTITGSTFKTADSGNRVEITADAGIGYSRFYSGDAAETAPGHVSGQYGNDRSTIDIISGANGSARKGRILVRSGPNSGGRANLVFYGVDNGGVNQEVDEHHYMGGTGSTHFYGAGLAERAVLADGHVTLRVPLWVDSIRHTNGGAPGLMDRGGNNLITFDWDGTNIGIYVDNVLEKVV